MSKRLSGWMAVGVVGIGLLSYVLTTTTEAIGQHALVAPSTSAVLPFAFGSWSGVADKSRTPNDASNASANSSRSLQATAAETKAQTASAPGRLQYNRDIRPILAENCFACHGPDSAARKADLRLDLREEAIAGGAIVPGKPDQSELIHRIYATDGEGLMPPANSKKKLTEEQKALLKRWVAEGAEYQPHWSLIPPQRPALPVVQDKNWPKNPIDHFILAELEKRGLKPAPEADRRTLARRLALDLTGLPPDPADVEAFVHDRDPNYYEKFVDKLLASPHWGEHRARYWLDYARYADTHGIHFDNYREIWAYRDWVIDAFNANMPFDQFTIEQLAGDLLPNPTLDQLIATGFQRNNITTNEGGVIPEEYIVLYARDRTETLATVWMGLTANCAVCHNHKYDPLTMRDFYSLSAFFNNTTQGAMDGNIPDTPPVIPVPRKEDRPRYFQLQKQIAALRQQMEQRRTATKPEFDKWWQAATPEVVLNRNPLEGLYWHAPLNEGSGNKAAFALSGQVGHLSLGDGYVWGTGQRGGKALTFRQSGSVVSIPEVGDFGRSQPFTVSLWIKVSRRNATGAVLARMDPSQHHRGWDVWLEGERPGIHIIHAWPDDAIKIVADNPLPYNKWNHLSITYDGSGKAEGITISVNGTVVPANVVSQKREVQGEVRTSAPLTINGRTGGQARLDNVSVEDVRLYTRKLHPNEIMRLSRSGAIADIVNKPLAQRNNQEKEEAFTWWLQTFDTPSQQLQEQLAGLQREEAAIRARGTVAHIMQERANSEPMAYILFRGEYDKRRDPVKADVPQILPPLPPELPRNRLGLAKWLCRPEHPLTARVTVNRFWQEVFGTGLVKTTGDFGVSGELPSHPELLDWLAVEFRESGWDIKKLFKLMVTSATYRQAAIVTPEKLEKDRENRLLSRGPRFRMDAEMIRDYALAASGLLVRKIGGPSVKPYQPDGVWEAVAMIGSNTRYYKRDSGENLYRRSMYTFWKRSAPPASMEILNAPNRETCCVRRERTNTPLQALVTLNDVQFVEAARVLAEKALQHNPADEVRLDFIARRVLCRPLEAREVQVLQDNLRDLRSYYTQHQEEARKLITYGEHKSDSKLDAAELAAWTMIANQLLNLDEVLNK
jgi:mono/diheme cytochrome c family protein